MWVIRACYSSVLCLILGAMAGQAWGQGLAVFPKEEILLVGGDFRIRSIHSNIAASDTLGGGESGGFPTEDGKTKSFLDTRLRLYWDFRPSDLLRVHYRMEIGDVRFGGGVDNGSDVSGNIVPVIGPGSGGGVGADGVNVETKNIFLEFAIPAIQGLSFRGGILGYGDRYDFNILADDFAGFQLLYRRGDVAAHLVYFKFFEGATRDNADDSHWFGVDGELQINENTRAAATFYYWLDQEHRVVDGVKPYQFWAASEVISRLTSGLGPLQMKAYAIYSQGEGFFGRRQGKNHGFNLSLAGDLSLRLATLGLQVQYISGERGSKLQIEGGTKDRQNIGAWVSYYNRMYQGPEIISLGPIIDIGDGFGSKWGTGNGFFNGDYNGRLLFIARSTFPLHPSLDLHVVGAYDRAAARNVNGDSTRGVELDVWAQWNIFPKLWFRFGGGYYITGDWWKNNPDASFTGRSPGVANPDNIWQFGTRLQYDFG
ncbi:MAG: hypothetical protein AB7N91_29920 [Candidatus Tectimicrobiota bacterium]